MYLTKIPIDTNKNESRQLLANPHRMHAAVCTVMTGDITDTDGRLLWRVDIKSNGQRELYVLSPGSPNVDNLVRQLNSDSTVAVTRDYQQLLNRISVGQEYRFRLVANPTHQSKQDGRSLRYGHTTPIRQITWLLDRAEGNGFAISTSSAIPAINVIDSRKVHYIRQGTHCVYMAATYDGILKISNRQAFIHLMTHGIGKSRAYGCGLLTLAKL